MVYRATARLSRARLRKLSLPRVAITTASVAVRRFDWSLRNKQDTNSHDREQDQ